MGSRNNLYYTIEAFHREVTATCMILTIHFPNNVECKIMIDSGLAQEVQYEDSNRDIPYNLHNIDFVCLTHSHLDHIGKLPYIVKNGYSNPIFCTPLTKAASKLIFDDCVNIFERDYLKELKENKNAPLPLYDETDVERTLNLMQTRTYNQMFSPFEGIYITFLDNGHLLGASSILIEVYYKNLNPFNFIFTGDMKNKSEFKTLVPFSDRIFNLNNLQIIQESTYGTTDSSMQVYEFEQKLCEAIDLKHTILIASIAQERLATILNKLKTMQEKGILNSSIPIIVDTNLGIKFLKLYKNNINFNFIPDNVVFVNTPEMREIVLNSPTQKIILASSGMLDKGISPFYAFKFLADPTKTIILTSYLAENSTGRKIVEARQKKKVSIFRNEESVPKLASVHQISDFSSHSKRDDLIEFLSMFKNVSYVFVNHGQTDVKKEYAKYAEDILNINTKILDDTCYYKVTSNNKLYEFVKAPSMDKELNSNKHSAKKKTLISKTVPIQVRKNAFFNSSSNNLVQS